MFDLVSKYKPSGDQPEAIKELVSGIEDDKKYQVLLGATGTGKTFTIANVIKEVNKPTLVLAHNKTLAGQLYSELKELFPNNHVCYFVSYYDYYQPEAYVPSSDTYIEKDSRGGAFKPRTSPYSFQGLGLEGLDILCEAKAATGLPIVTELMSAEYLDVFNEKVDLIQIGARNMQNFDLLKQLGQVDRPILLKRGLNATYEEWLMSAEYIMASGNENVILCERGVRTFESYTRNTLDLQSIPVIQKLSHLPIIIDPSHAGGKWWLVEPMAKAAVAAGANGLMIEVHNNPEMALCDGSQSLKPAKYDALLKQVAEIAKVVGKTF